MTSEWKKLAEDFEDGQRQDAVKAARRRFQRPDKTDWQWLADSLNHESIKWFIAAVFKGYPVPKRLFEPFLQAAIHETNPSFNRQFVEPCIASFGHRIVNEYLLDVVESDDGAAIAGAVAALYWANMAISFTGNVPEYTLEYATPETRAAFLELKDVWKRKRESFLRIFIANEDVAVRRQIIPSLVLDESKYGVNLKPFVDQAIAIAREHSDEYIRHRVEVQLGNEVLLRPLPDHKKESDEPKHKPREK